MNLENPSSIISSATNTVAQIASITAEKLGPITTKTIEVVSRQVVVDAVTLTAVVIILGIVCPYAIKLAMYFNAKVTCHSSGREDDFNIPMTVISAAIAVLSGIAFLVTLIVAITDVPTAIFNTEYATAEKFVEIFKQIKP